MTIGQGGTLTDAAHMASVPVEDVALFITRSPEFAAEVKRAEAQCKLYHLSRIRDGDRGWQSSAWFLEHRFPQEYSLRPGIEKEQEKIIKVRRIQLGQGVQQLIENPDPPLSLPSPDALGPGEKPVNGDNSTDFTGNDAESEDDIAQEDDTPVDLGNVKLAPLTPLEEQILKLKEEETSDGTDTDGEEIDD